MTPTQTGQQPQHPAERPPSMGPLDIARSRLHDLALGALPDLFDQASAVHIAKRLEYLEQRYDGLRRAAAELLANLNHVQLTGDVADLVHLTRSIDSTAEELNQP